MAGESVADFAAKATLDNKQFITASRETASRARQLARDLKEADRQAKADAAAKAGSASLDQALSWGKAVYGINAAAKSLGALNDMLRTAGDWTKKLQVGLEGLPVIGGLAKEGGNLGNYLFGPSDSDMVAEAERLAQETNRKQSQYRDQEKKQQKEREDAARDAEARRKEAYDKEIEREKRVDSLLRDQYTTTQMVFATEEERRAAKERDVLRALEEAGATREEWFYAQNLLKVQREREDVVKRIDDTNDHMAQVARDLQDAERKRREDYDYMLDVEKELTALKKEQVEHARELEQAGKRSVAAMEAGSSAAYSAAVRAGARTGMGSRSVEVALRQIAMSSSRTARNTFANRVTTVDSF